MKFVSDLYNRRHLAMIEHLWVHVLYDAPAKLLFDMLDLFSTNCQPVNTGCVSEPFQWTKHLSITEVNGKTYISGPIRVFIELDLFISGKGKSFLFSNVPIGIQCLINSVKSRFSILFSNLDYEADENTFRYISEDSLVCDFLGKNVPKEALMNHVTHTVHFVCDRGVSHELVRHREDISFGQESTRYCNYSLAKFDECISVIKPFFFERDPGTKDNVLYDESAYSYWLCGMEHCAATYFKLLSMGRTPQEARSVLPNSLKTEIILTANETEWQHIINLRYIGTTGAPHPQMKEVMTIASPYLVRASEYRLTMSKEDV